MDKSIQLSRQEIINFTEMFLADNKSSYHKADNLCRYSNYRWSASEDKRLALKRSHLRVDFEEYFKKLGYDFKISVVPSISKKFWCKVIITGDTSSLVHYRMKYGMK